MTTSIISPEMTVNEAIRLHPATVGVFNEFGIDACCGGAVPVRDAALRDGADPDRLMTALNQAAVKAAP